MGRSGRVWKKGRGERYGSIRKKDMNEQRNSEEKQMGEKTCRRWENQVDGMTSTMGEVVKAKELWEERDYGRGSTEGKT